MQCLTRESPFLNLQKSMISTHTNAIFRDYDTVVLDLRQDLSKPKQLPHTSQVYLWSCKTEIRLRLLRKDQLHQTLCQLTINDNFASL